MKHIRILGIRGLPASHGGFETFAEYLAKYLVDNGWKVTVYCQETTESCSEIKSNSWNGIQLIHIPVKGDNAYSTIKFDFLSVKHAAARSGIVLTLGYNTAIFNILFRLSKITNIINMDGIEWRREKWGIHEKIWLYLNERLGCLIGNHLVADHPEIKKHLATRVSESKITMIPYGARQVTEADKDRLAKYGLEPKSYALVIARPEPENSVHEIVSAFSRKSRGHRLVVLGNYHNDNPYHNLVTNSASNEVLFLGAIYDHDDLDALRFYSSLYIHGHTVGGTNPSLIEALGSGQPVLAHDNKFNRWVAGEGAEYFSSILECENRFDKLLCDPQRLEQLSEASYKRFEETFTWPVVLTQYEELLQKSITAQHNKSN